MKMASKMWLMHSATIAWLVKFSLGPLKGSWAACQYAAKAAMMRPASQMISNAGYLSEGTYHDTHRVCFHMWHCGTDPPTNPSMAALIVYIKIEVCKISRIKKMKEEII